MILLERSATHLDGLGFGLGLHDQLKTGRKETMIKSCDVRLLLDQEKTRFHCGDIIVLYKNMD